MKKNLKIEKLTHKNFFKKKSRGFMMIEIIIVTSIIFVSVLAAMSVAQKSISLSRQIFHTSQATFLLEEGAEIMRITRDNSWSNISNLSSGIYYYPSFSGSWTLSTTPSSPIGIFTRKIIIANVNRNVSSGKIESLGVNDPGTKLVTIEISWIEGGEIKNKTLSFYIMDVFS